ncbi:hypothetical protein ACNKHN_21730 [Shigella flexneri]
MPAPFTTDDRPGYCEAQRQLALADKNTIAFLADHLQGWARASRHRRAAGRIKCWNQGPVGAGGLHAVHCHADPV